MPQAGTWALPLQGWDRRSVWGWDEGMGSWWAHLWRNDRPDDPVADAPHVAIGPPRGPTIGDVTMLIVRIAEATGADRDHIDQLLVESSR